MASMKQLSGLFLVLALAGCAHPARAGMASVTVIDRDTGQALPVYVKGQQRYVAGQPGHRYAVRVKNHTAARMLAVISIDGVNVVTGQTASWQQSGYVFDAWRGYEVAGWRKSESEVAAFEFAALSQSYAAQTGRPGDVGVIGVAVFAEQREAVLHEPVLSGDARPRREAARAAAPAAPRAEGLADESRASSSSHQGAGALDKQSERLGTAHGERETSHTRHTHFERSTASPVQVLSIRYDSFENLVAMGVIPRPRLPQPQPNPFPAERETGFVPDPPRHW